MRLDGKHVVATAIERDLYGALKRRADQQGYSVAALLRGLIICYLRPDVSLRDAIMLLKLPENNR